MMDEKCIDLIDKFGPIKLKDLALKLKIKQREARKLTDKFKVGCLIYEPETDVFCLVEK